VSHGDCVSSPTHAAPCGHVENDMCSAEIMLLYVENLNIENVSVILSCNVTLTVGLRIKL